MSIAGRICQLFESFERGSSEFRAAEFALNIDLNILILYLVVEKVSLTGTPPGRATGAGRAFGMSHPVGAACAYCDGVFVEDALFATSHGDNGQAAVPRPEIPGRGGPDQLHRGGHRVPDGF